MAISEEEMMKRNEILSRFSGEIKEMIGYDRRHMHDLPPAFAEFSKSVVALGYRITVHGVGKSEWPCTTPIAGFTLVGEGDTYEDFLDSCERFNKENK